MEIHIPRRGHDVASYPPSPLVVHETVQTLWEVHFPSRFRDTNRGREAAADDKHFSFRDALGKLEIWDNLSTWHYRFETTFGVYVMDSVEKFVFYTVVVPMMLAMLFLVYWLASKILAVLNPLPTDWKGRSWVDLGRRSVEVA